MKKYIPFALILLFLAAGCASKQGEQTISLNDFKTELNSSGNISIVMDMRNSTSSGVVMQCGTDIAGRLGIIGKYQALGNHTFVYEDNQCISISGNHSVEYCESLVSDSLAFYIQYNPTKNSTDFYKTKAVISGDNDFLADCSISRII